MSIFPILPASLCFHGQPQNKIMPAVRPLICLQLRHLMVREGFVDCFHVNYLSLLTYICYGFSIICFTAWVFLHTMQVHVLRPVWRIMLCSCPHSLHLVGTRLRVMLYHPYSNTRQSNLWQTAGTILRKWSATDSVSCQSCSRFPRGLRCTSFISLLWKAPEIHPPHYD